MALLICLPQLQSTCNPLPLPACMLQPSCAAAKLASYRRHYTSKALSGHILTCAMHMACAIPLTAAVTGYQTLQQPVARPLPVACCSFNSPGLPEDEQSWATTEADNLGFSAASTAWARIVLAVRHYEVS